jgi:uncharacterized protein YjbI with pentapeptide repeats
MAAIVVVIPQWHPRPLNIFRADLKGKWLAEVNLRNASAGLANLESTVLQGANLQRARLWGANLQHADLWGANLQDANLQGANLQGADLREVTGLTPAQLQAAQTDAHTQLPAALPHLRAVQ